MPQPIKKKAAKPKRVMGYQYPSEKHKAFHEAWKTSVRILCGGYGSGKSHSAAAEILRHLMFNPIFFGQKALVVGLTASHNRDQLLPEFKKVLTCEAKGRNIGYVEGTDYTVSHSPTLKITLHVAGGAEIIFKSLEAGTNLAGFNVAMALADEIDKIDLETWNEVQNRVRTVEGGFVIGTCNPSNKSHWLYDRYFKKFDTDGIPDTGVWLSYLTCYDNKFLPKDVVERYERQYGYSALERERAIMGRFVSMQGCVYASFDRDRHTIDRKDINVGENWEVNAGLDFGFKDPTAALWVAKTPEGRYVVFREHYQTEKPVSFHANEIKKSSGPHIRKPTKIYSDHYSETVVTYREQGVELTLADKGKGSLYQGIQLISQLLHEDRLLVTRNCVNLIREFETYQWKKTTGSSNGDEPADRNQHALDALRYVIAELEGKPSLSSFGTAMSLAATTVQTYLKEVAPEPNLILLGYDHNGKPQYARMG